MTGSGKSTRVKELLKERKRVIVFDTQDEYRSLHFKAFEAGGPIKQWLASQWMKDNFAVAYVPRPGQEAESLHALCRFLIACQEPYKTGADTRPITLVVEEMDMSFPVSMLPRELNGMYDMCNRGRHYGIEVIGVSQSPAQVSATFRQNMSEVFVFALGFHNHRAAMIEILGPDHKQALADLSSHEYLYYCDGKVSTGRNPPL